MINLNNVNMNEIITLEETKTVEIVQDNDISMLSGVASDSQAAQLAKQMSSGELVRIMEQLENLAPLHHFDGDSPLERHLTMHIEATVLQSAGDHAGAYRILQSILADEDAPVPVLLYRVLHDMETCCKALDDYKGAYDHALHKLSVQEKLLAESTV